MHQENINSGQNLERQGNASNSKKQKDELNS